MNENKFLNDYPEQVVLNPNPRKIEINYARAERAYGLFDSETGTQVTGFKKGTDGKVEGMGDDKPQFAIAWNFPMKDETDDILKNSGNLPVIYPKPYVIIDNNNENNIFDIVDDKGETVGQVMNLSQTGDKPKFEWVCTLKIKDDTQK